MPAMHRFRNLALALAAVSAAPAAVLAQTEAPCADREALTEQLSAQFSEALTGRGLQDTERLLEVWASPGGESWTILLTRPDGVACIVAHGTHWMDGLPDARVAGLPG